VTAASAELAALGERVSATDRQLSALADAVVDVAGKVTEIFAFMEEACTAAGIDRPSANGQRRDRHGLRLVKGGLS